MKAVHVKIRKAQGTEDIPLPRYQSKGASGMDLLAAVEAKVFLEPGEIKLIPTGIHISIPEGYEAQVRPRSGLALKDGIGIVNAPGTIDSDYRGEVGIILINFGKKSFAVKRGDRVAQLVFVKVERAVLY